MSGDPNKISLSEKLSVKFTNNLLSLALTVLIVSLLMHSVKGDFSLFSFSIGCEFFTYLENETHQVSKLKLNYSN